MMKGKAKILSLLLALAMSASVFAACGDNGGGSSTPSNSSGSDSSKVQTDNQEPDGNGDVVNLVWWHYGEQPKNPDRAIAALNEKSAKDIGITITFNYAGDGTQQKVAMQTGAADDILFTCAWYVNYATAAQQGQLYDITDKVKNDTPELWNYIPDYVWKGSEINGRIYAVPTYKDVAASQFWTCNKDFVFDTADAEAEFKATGMKFSTVTPLLEKLKNYADTNLGGKYPNDLTAPYYMNKGGIIGADMWFNAVLDSLHIGIKQGDSSNKVVSYFDDADYIEDLKTLSEWHKAGYINADCMQIDREPEFMVVGSSKVWEGGEANLEAGKNYKVAINRRCGPYATTSFVTGSMNGIFANSKHPDESLQYLQYINTNAEYRNMLAYGVEGENWKDNGDGTVTKLNSDYEPYAFAQATFFLLKPVAPAAADMYTTMKAEMEKAELSDLLGFTLNQDSIQTEVAACTTVFEKYMSSFMTGSFADVDASVAEMIKELEAVGYRRVIEEAQTQVDAFLGE